MIGCCRDCALELFGDDNEDFSGMISRLLVEAGYGLLVRCEHCGPALVDGDGGRLTAQFCDA